jgi:hypothetical protein
MSESPPRSAWSSPGRQADLFDAQRAVFSRRMTSMNEIAGWRDGVDALVRRDRGRVPDARPVSDQAPERGLGPVARSVTTKADGHPAVARALGPGAAWRNALGHEVLPGTGKA